MLVAEGFAGAFVRSGKVRDLYALDDERLLLVASDRLSAFDVVLPTSIPDKGRILTGLSRWWFDRIDESGIVAHHLLGTDPADLPSDWSGSSAELRGRMMLCRRADPLQVELIVRGYLAGSGWSDYRATGGVCGIPLPSGLREGDRLPGPIVTPSTKAQAGHDQNIGLDQLTALVGGPVAERAQAIVLDLYRLGTVHAERAGILLADTKFELGVLPAPEGVDPQDPAGRAERLILIDEVLTPDSSRFWEAPDWAPGGPQPSFDKQYVRDWLLASGWDRLPPGPDLPPQVVAGTRARYVAAFERITGTGFARYLVTDAVGR